LFYNTLCVTVKLVEQLTSGNPDVVIKAILTLRDTIPSSPCLKVIAMLLVTMNTQVEQCISEYTLYSLFCFVSW